MAVAAALPALACCAALAGGKPEWALPAGLFVCLMGAGSACVYYGRKWNRPAVRHSLLYLPLQAWGWLYLSLVALPAVAVWGFILAYATGAVRPAPGTYDPDRPFYMGLAATVALAVVGVAGWRLQRTNRRRASAASVSGGVS